MPPSAPPSCCNGWTAARLFTWQQIPKMMELKALLEAAVAQHPEWPAAERGNLLGECDLIQSFLFYNDITQMSRLHRSASRQMSRPAVTLRNSGSWTFGSPSVLMMYYRAPGELGKELAEMYECMPHYYKITTGHGQGAELLMDAEAAYLQGAWEKAAVLLERARADAAGQENMTLCCDFLSLRLALCGLLSEIPFDLAIGGQPIDPGYQNVLWTFCIAAAALWAMEALQRRLQIPLPLAALCAGAAGYLLGEALQSDYFGPGVLTVLVFALCRQWHIGRLPELAAMLVINGWLLPSADMTLWGVTLPVELLATAALLPIWLYRGRQGPHGPWLRWVWYGFYPAHLLALWLIYTKTC